MPLKMDSGLKLLLEVIAYTEVTRMRAKLMLRFVNENTRSMINLQMQRIEPF